MPFSPRWPIRQEGEPWDTFSSYYALASSASVGSRSLAQAACANGSRASMSGTIDSVVRSRPEAGGESWRIYPKGARSIYGWRTAEGNCEVIFLYGKGQPPTGCSAGKNFNASGAVRPAGDVPVPGYIDDVLVVDNLRCN